MRYSSTFSRCLNLAVSQTVQYSPCTVTVLYSQTELTTQCPRQLILHGSIMIPLGTEKFLDIDTIKRITRNGSSIRHWILRLLNSNFQRGSMFWTESGSHLLIAIIS